MKRNKKIQKITNVKKYIFLFFILLLLVGCTDNNKKIVGEWQRIVTENDGGEYVETYTFYDESHDNRVEYSYVPLDYSHIGFQASGRWDLDIMGNLELYLDPKTAKAIYNYYPDEWQQFQIDEYIREIKIGLAQQMKEMQEASIGLEISEDVLSLETLSSKERFDRVY